MRSANPLFSCNKILSAWAWLFSVPPRRTAWGRLLFCAWSSILTLIHLHLQWDVISFQLDGSGQEVEWLLVLSIRVGSLRGNCSVLFCVFLMFHTNTVQTLPGVMNACLDISFDFMFFSSVIRALGVAVGSSSVCFFFLIFLQAIRRREVLSWGEEALQVVQHWRTFPFLFFYVNENSSGTWIMDWQIFS